MTTRRLAIAGVLFGAIYSIAFLFVSLDFIAQLGIYGPGLIRTARIRALTWSLPVPCIFFLMRHVWTTTSRWFARALAVTAACIVAAFIAELTFDLFLAGHGWLRRGPASPAMPLSALLPATLISVHAPFMFLVCVSMAVQWLVVNDAERSTEVRVSELEMRLGNARLQLLRSQLHPHFLFNSLNSVATLIRHSPRQAKEMLDRLARFYEAATALDDENVITLERELDLIRQYVAIEQIRFGDRLDVQLSADAASLGARLPALLLQPIVENATKHGVGRTPGPGWVHVKATVAGKRLLIAVSNNGSCPPELGNGIGLANTRQRIELFGGGTLALMETDRSIDVVMDLPYVKEVA